MSREPGPGRRRIAARRRAAADGDPRTARTIAIAGGALVLLALVVHGLERLDDPADPPTPPPTGDRIAVVEGDVARPGPVGLPVDATLCDAWSAAGGDTAGIDVTSCDRAALDLHRVRRDGDFLRQVPLEAGERFALGRGLDPNLASASELDSIPQLPSAVAAAIVDAREEQPFCSLEALTRVRGIGDARLASIRPFLELRQPPPECGVEAAVDPR